MNFDVTIVGGGVSGLFSAYCLLQAGLTVAVYESMSGVGKKFLVAGHGGLNLTHNEDLTTFSTRYDQHQAFFKKLLNDFSPTDLRQWCLDLGIETFEGSTGRIFPKTMSAAQILINWTKKLKENPNFKLYTNCVFKEFDDKDNLIFIKDNQSLTIKTKYTVFALGGASWSKTGSNGLWAGAFNKRNINVTTFKAMNSGFDVEWSKYAQKTFNHVPIKNIKVTHLDKESRGELMLTPYGVEGGSIYFISKYIRENLTQPLIVDLAPDLSIEQIIQKLSKPRGKNSLSNHLRKALKIDSLKFTLLKELLSDSELNSNERLAVKLKALPIKLLKERPLDEAISTSGGIDFSEVNESLMLNKLSNVYVSGEMLDWDAPTGGYLLQGCFSTAYRVAKSIIRDYEGSSI